MNTCVLYVRTIVARRVLYIQRPGTQQQQQHANAVCALATNNRAHVCSDGLGFIDAAERVSNVHAHTIMRRTHTHTQYPVRANICTQHTLLMLRTRSHKYTYMLN